jgi:hypothetical protein
VPLDIGHRSSLTSRVWCLVLLAILAGCSTPTSPRWADDGIHIVDGYWILAEKPCDLASSDPCVVAVDTAEIEMAIDPKTVVRGATAGLPHKWVRSDGQEMTVIEGTSGTPSQFVVVDLADGSRRVIAFGCLGVPSPDGSTTCLAYPLDRYRVGNIPTD